MGINDANSFRSSLPIEITSADINPDFVFTGDEKVIAVSGGSNHSMAATNNGRVFTWGGNDHGQAGNDTTIRLLAPLDITGRMI